MPSKPVRECDVIIRRVLSFAFLTQFGVPRVPPRSNQNFPFFLRREIGDFMKRGDSSDVSVHGILDAEIAERIFRGLNRSPARNDFLADQRGPTLILCLWCVVHGVTRGMI